MIGNVERDLRFGGHAGARLRHHRPSTRTCPAMMSAWAARATPRSAFDERDVQTSLVLS
jgi:hypothetical protein